MMLKPCPFCGSEVMIDFRQLWRGSHGYHGCYEIFIKCDKCGCSNYGTISNTIQLTKEAAKKKFAWSEQIAAVTLEPVLSRIETNFCPNCGADMGGTP